MLIKSAVVLLIATTSVAMTTANNDFSICRNGFCGEISYDQILSMYRGLFVTEEQRREKEHKMLTTRVKDLHSEGLDAHKVLNLPGDGDSCCATNFSHVKRNSMVNTNGDTRYIVHMPDATPSAVFQLIPEGSCVEGYGDCDGECFMEPMLLNLLVWDQSPTATWPYLIFDWFEVPGYCSCKNVLTPELGGSSGTKLSASSSYNTVQ